MTMMMKITTKPDLRVNTVEETGQKLPIFLQMSIMIMVQLHGRAGLARYYKVLKPYQNDDDDILASPIHFLLCFSEAILHHL